MDATLSPVPQAIFSAAGWLDGDLPPIDVSKMTARLVRTRQTPEPILLARVPTRGRRVLRLCDFGSAGEAGSPYCSWLPAVNVPSPKPFTRSNPLRALRP